MSRPLISQEAVVLESPVPALPSGVMRGGVVALASRGGGLVVSLLTGIVTARVLGPDGKGSLAFLSAVAAMMVRLGSLGLDGSFTQFFLARRRPLADCVGAVVWTTLLAGTLAAVIVDLILVTSPTSMPVVPVSLGVPFFASAPAFFMLFVSTFIFFAVGREMFFGVFDISYRLALLIAMVVVLYGMAGGLAGSVWVQIGVSVAFASIAFVAIGRLVGWRLPFNRPLIREMLAYGVRYYAYGLVRYALCYQAILLAGIVLTDRDTGILSVSVMLGETLMLFAGSVNLAFYPAVSTSSEPHRYTTTVAIRLLALSLTMAIGLALVARPLVVRLYGAAFEPAVHAFFWLAPGYVLLSAEQVTSSYFAANGMPWWIVAVFLTGIVVAGLLAVVLAPRFGVNSVAASISIAQALVSLIVVGRFARAR